MIRLRFDFPAERYHATPWGHHVNEGLVEWPPSPWRILRALLATGYAKLGWHDVPEHMRRMVELLAASEPQYLLPHATSGHSRHYMPLRGLKKNGMPETTKVIDAFVKPTAPLIVEWPVAEDKLPLDLLKALLSRLGYLGRAESRVRAHLAGREDDFSGFLVSTERRNPDDEPVRLLAPMSSQSYEFWRCSCPEAPKDLIAALQMDTRTLQEERWSHPPGTRELIYWRPADALGQLSSRRWSGRVSNASGDEYRCYDTALFALSTDTKREVLPLMHRALPTMKLFRRALLSRVGDQQCPELTGKDEDGHPLRSKHQHAHFIPLSLDGRKSSRIDHVLVHAPMGFGRIAENALRRLQRTWAKGTDDIAVTLVGVGKRELFQTIGQAAVPELGSGTKWVSRTPFVPPRFLKPRGKDSIQSQVRAELERRGFPDLSAEPVIALPNADIESGRYALWFRHFVRRHRGNCITQAPAGVFHLTLTFNSVVHGPICLGWGSHYGLGVFIPGAD